MVTRCFKFALVASSCLAVAIASHAAGFVSDFNSGQPAGSTVVGSAFVDSSGGVGGSGVLKVTASINGQQGSFYVPGLGGSTAVTNFKATFRLALGGGTCCGFRQADGMAFAMGNDLPSPVVGTFGEEGAGTGLIVGFDTWDNAGSDTAPALDVKVGGTADGNVVAFQSMYTFDGAVRDLGRAPAGPVLTNSAGAEVSIFTFGPAPTLATDESYVNVYIELFPDNTFSMSFSNVVVWNHLPLPTYVPVLNPTFAFGARTGGANESAFIDNLAIFANFSTGAVRVISQPTNITVIDTQTATFYLQPDGTPPYNVQWFSNGVAIAGATGLTYTTPPTTTNMNGTVYRAELSNVDGSTVSSNAVLTVTPGVIALSASAAGRADRVFVTFSKPVALTGTYALDNATTVIGAAYGTSHREVVLTTSTLAEGAAYTLTITGETGEDASPLIPNPSTLNFKQISGSFCTDFNAGLPPGTATNGIFGPYIGDDGAGHQVLHLNDDAVTGMFGNFYISNQSGGTVLHSLDAAWQMRIGGPLLGNADGFSFNWANDISSSGAFLAAEEGAGTGVSFTIDTWDNGSGPDTGIEIKWRGTRIAFMHIDRNGLATDNIIARDVFVPVHATVDSAGRATFTYETNTITAIIPNWPGITNGAMNMIARTGGEADNVWIDDLCITNFSLGPVSFVQQPVSTSVFEGTAATFFAVVDGTPPYSFQWFTNGVAVAGATSGSLTLSSVTPAQDGLAVSVVVSNSFSTVTSSNAILDVLINPRVVSVFTSGDNEVHVIYTRAVALGEGLAVYEFDNGGFEQERRYGTNHSEVIIVTDAPLLPGTTYTLTIRDVAGEGDPSNVISPNPTIRTFRHGYGSVCTDFAAGLPAGAVVTGSANVSGDGILHITDTVNSQSGSFYLPDPNGGFAVDRLLINFRTLIGSPVPGTRIADGFSLNFGSDVGSAVNSEEGAGSAGLTVSFDTWDNATTDTAPAIEVRYRGTVVATQAMAGIREGGRAPSGPFLIDANGNPLSLDTSNAFVNFSLSIAPDGKMDLYFKDYPIFRNLQLPNYRPFTNANLNISGRTGGANENAWIDNLCINGFSLGGPTITTQPADTTINELTRAFFTVAVDGLPPYSVQWYSNGVALAGATALSYVTPVLDRVSEGVGYSAIISNSFGSITTRTAIVSINRDLIAPSIVSAAAQAYGDYTNILVKFSERLNPASAVNALNYTLDHGATVTGATIGEGDRWVMLTVSALDPLTCYRLTVNGVRDASTYNATSNLTAVVSIPQTWQASGAQNVVVIDAEQFDVNLSPAPTTPTTAWVVANALPGYLGSGYVEATPNTGAFGGDSPNLFTNAIQLAYSINFPVAGTNYLWARGSTANDGGNNSFHFGLDGVSPDEFTRRVGNRTNNWGADPGNVNAFGWVRDVNGSGGGSVARIYVPTAGRHTLNVWMREDGLRLDRFLLTTDPAFTLAVTDVGPAVSVRTPAASQLSISRATNGTVTLSWPGVGFTLQGAPELKANPAQTQWQNLPFTSPVEIPAGFFGTGNTNVFFRLICP